jgi:hypothetical protein
MAFLARFRRNRNRDSCSKRATGTEINRKGIGNLGSGGHSAGRTGPHGKYDDIAFFKSAAVLLAKRAIVGLLNSATFAEFS